MGVATRTDRPTGSATSGFARRERGRISPALEPTPSGGDGRWDDRAPPPQPQIVGAAAGAADAVEHDIALEDVAGARLLVSDVRTALLLLDEARYRVIKRLFGVKRFVRGLEGPVLAGDADRARAGCPRSTREIGSDAQGTGRPNPNRRRARRRNAEGTVHRDPRTIVPRHAIGRHSGDDRHSGSPGPSRSEPHGPRHQNLVAPGPALVHPSLRSPAAHIRRGQATFWRTPRRPPPASVAEQPWRHSIRRPRRILVTASARSDLTISGLDGSWPSA